MKRESIQIDYTIFSSLDSTPKEWKGLIETTIQQAKNAYAPYSQFNVSACSLLSNGMIVKGSNVENASYPVSICAERTTLTHVISNYPEEKIEIMAIFVDKEVGAPVPPCGLCRQSLLEAELRQKHPIQILLISKEGSLIHFDSAKSLLPLYFEGSVL